MTVSPLIVIRTIIRSQILRLQKSSRSRDHRSGTNKMFHEGVQVSDISKRHPPRTTKEHRHACVQTSESRYARPIPSNTSRFTTTSNSGTVNTRSGKGLRGSAIESQELVPPSHPISRTLGSGITVFSKVFLCISKKASRFMTLRIFTQDTLEQTTRLTVRNVLPATEIRVSSAKDVKSVI